MRVKILWLNYSAEFFLGRPRVPSTRILCAISLIRSRGKRGSFDWTNFTILSMLTDGFFSLLAEDEFCHIGFPEPGSFD